MDELWELLDEEKNAKPPPAYEDVALPPPYEEPRDLPPPAYPSHGDALDLALDIAPSYREYEELTRKRYSHIRSPAYRPDPEAKVAVLPPWGPRRNEPGERWTPQDEARLREAEQLLEDGGYTSPSIVEDWLLVSYVYREIGSGLTCRPFYEVMQFMLKHPGFIDFDGILAYCFCFWGDDRPRPGPGRAQMNDKELAKAVYWYSLHVKNPPIQDCMLFMDWYQTFRADRHPPVRPKTEVPVSLAEVAWICEQRLDAMRVYIPDDSQ
jgi:hypothetical protein